MPRMRPDRLILQRQKQERLYEDRISAAIENSSLQKLAEWENKGGQVHRQQRVEARIADLRKRRQLFLDHRRAKLSQLLNKEEEMYAKELEERRETTDGQNDKIKERAMKLKAEREEERARIAKEK
ncbi:Coiled-coil domain containing 11, partial [Perkinsus chesapeaki]